MNGVWDDDSLIYKLNDRTYRVRDGNDSIWLHRTHIAMSLMDKSNPSDDPNIEHIWGAFDREDVPIPQAQAFVVASRENNLQDRDGIGWQVVGEGATAEEARELLSHTGPTCGVDQRLLATGNIEAEAWEAAEAQVARKVLSGEWFPQPVT